VTGEPTTQQPAAIRILLVEDDAADARLIGLALAEEADVGFAVTRVASLADALALAGGEPFGAILTDLALPDATGLQTVEAMLAAWPDTPVIVLTGADNRSTGLSAVQLGCQDFLAKSSSDGALLRRSIRHAMERFAVARALKESEARFRALVELSPDAILLCTDTTILFANSAAVTAFAATTAPALLAVEPLRLIAAEDVEMVRQALAVPTHRMECRMRRLDGSTFEAELAFAAVAHQGRPAIQIVLRDITGHKLAEHRSFLARMVFETTSEGIVVTDAANRIVAVNPGFSAVTGYAPEEMLGQNPKRLSSGRNSPEFYAEMWATLYATGHWRGEVWNRRKSGEVYVQRLAVSLIRDAAGRVVNHLGIFSDVTDERIEAESNRWRASYDALTGLPNRTLLSDRLQRDILQAARAQGRIGVLFLDLDDFKPVNDRHGHLAGDKVLIQVARRLQNCVRESDTVARLGGDEFVIVLPEVASARDTGLVAAKILTTLALPITGGDGDDEGDIVIGASIGIALFPGDGRTPEQLLSAADRAMYMAKKQGGRFVFLHPEP